MEPDRRAAAGFMCSDTGGEGPVVVLLHGVLTSGSLWDDVVDGLRDHYRCIVPELPFGAHRTPDARRRRIPRPKATEGKTRREARRAHKRHLANRVIRRMWRDETARNSTLALAA